MKALIPWAVAFFLVAAGVFLWNREHRLRTDAQRDAEASRLTLQGQIVAAEKSKADLAQSVDALTRGNSELRDALAKAQRAAPGARVTGAGRLDTGAMRVMAPPKVASATAKESPRAPQE